MTRVDTALALALQRCVEEEAPGSNKNIAYEGNQKHCIVAVLQTISYALAGKIHEQQVGEGVDNLCSV